MLRRTTGPFAFDSFDFGIAGDGAIVGNARRLFTLLPLSTFGSCHFYVILSGETLS
jgi:hypothetical protein